MITRSRMLLLCAVLSACSSKDSVTAPAVVVASVQVSLPSNTFYVGVSVQASVAVTDQSGETMSETAFA